MEKASRPNVICGTRRRPTDTRSIIIFLRAEPPPVFNGEIRSVERRLILYRRHARRYNDGAGRSTAIRRSALSNQALQGPRFQKSWRFTMRACAPTQGYCNAGAVLISRFLHCQRLPDIEAN